MPSLAPFDGGYIADVTARIGAIVTIEEHGPGGLATAVSEYVAEHGLRPTLAQVRLPNKPLATAGGQDDLRRLSGYVETILQKGEMSREELLGNLRDLVASCISGECL